MTLAEGVQLVTFGILVAMTIGGALGVVLLENIVYSAFLLGIVFVSNRWLVHFAECRICGCGSGPGLRGEP